MSDRYKGAILSPTAPTVTQQSAGGVYTLSQQTQYQGQGVWPTAANNPLTRSLRFRASASAYLNRTPASAGNRKTWTWSGWVKRGAIPPSGVFRGIFTANYSNVPWFFLGFGNGNTLDIAATAGSSASWQTTAVFRDPAAWYHIVCVVDTTSATSTMNGSSTDRFRLYVNGVQYVISGGTVPTQNSDLQVNNTVSHTVGGYSGEFFDGYMGEINFIDGLALTPSSFGTTDVNGIWQPIPYTGTYGTNGFYLPFTDNSALTTSSNVGLGKDFSGNGNYWITNNISITADSTYDSMTDVPTNTNPSTSNYATLNPLNRAYNTVTYSSANLQGSSAFDWCAMIATINVTSGKWYWECRTTDSNTFFGIQSQPQNYENSNPQNFVGTIAYYASNGEKRIDGSSISYGSSYTGGDVVGVALDVDGGTITFYKNNSSQGVINLSESARMVGQIIAPFFAGYGNTVTINFGQQPFAYTPPTGFNRLNTYNIPAPTILAGNQNMAVTLYTGTGTAGQVQTNSSSMQPDLTWIKQRNGTGGQGWWDSVRGATKYLASQNTDAEGTSTVGVTSFNSNGFTVGSDSWTGGNGSTYVGWQWRASNAAGVSNTQGTITSTVSANTTSGFSIVTFTGNGTSSQTVGHGLGVTPTFFILKSRGVQVWNVYSLAGGITGNTILQLNDTAGAVTGSNINLTASSTTIGFGSASQVNGSGVNFVAYVFAPVAGYSAFGSYTGNGFFNGPFIYTGFRPKFWMVKRTNADGLQWEVFDSSRFPYNGIDNPTLYPNANTAEASNAENGGDFLSNGFKLRYNNGNFNAANGTYIYMAFAENPFKIARAR
jgi:hypothetical protein